MAVPAISPIRCVITVTDTASPTGVGIADQLRDAMVADGATAEQATAQVWLVDKQGLLFDDIDDLRDFQTPYAKNRTPDGTIIFTAPTGHTYVSEPHGATLFPALRQPTGELDLGAAASIPDANRAVMMPKRTQTREQDRRDRIAAERRERTDLIAEEERQRQAWLVATYEPPPF
jgi:malic enzyme